jgi:hypothetical protein
MEVQRMLFRTKDRSEDHLVVSGAESRVRLHQKDSKLKKCSRRPNCYRKNGEKDSHSGCGGKD